MNKQKKSNRNETDILLQNIAERQRELTSLSNNMQKADPQKTLEFNFNWESKFEHDINFLKLSKAI